MGKWCNWLRHIRLRSVHLRNIVGSNPTFPTKISIHTVYIYNELTIFVNMRTDILDKKEIIIKWISENQSKAFMCKELKCKPETLNFWLNEMKIAYSGNQGRKNLFKGWCRKTALEYLESDKYISIHKLRIKLIQDGVKEHKCETCNLTEWNGNKIPLELHHIDGDRYNNKLQNIQILCPNCHSQTENYSGKNKGKCNLI